jgi:enoyl-CoA hydratase/carnithine racemase
VSAEDSFIQSRRLACGLAVILNRPDAINSLTEGMIDAIEALLDEALADKLCRFVLFYSSSARGFCAGGDVKELARLSAEKKFDRVDAFFRKEYGLKLRLHLFPKPVIAVADGITMGGGLGIAAGAGISIATERTLMAMPETRIGFFPDVGSTGWMFARCPRGYPEYLGLTGYDLRGADCVRVGFATHLMPSERLPDLIGILEGAVGDGKAGRREAEKALLERISALLDFHVPVNRELDDWVERYFAGVSGIREMLETLSLCREQEEHCDRVFSSIAERSPTALALTLKLLRHNEGRPLEEVFAAELKAARWMTRHPDYIEGIRARLIERDNKPRWKPDRIEDVDLSEFQP